VFARELLELDEPEEPDDEYGVALPVSSYVEEDESYDDVVFCVVVVAVDFVPAPAVPPTAIAAARTPAAPTLMPAATTRLRRNRRLRPAERRRRARAPGSWGSGRLVMGASEHPRMRAP
jgi:hypothetical protein